MHFRMISQNRNYFVVNILLCVRRSESRVPRQEQKRPNKWHVYSNERISKQRNFELVTELLND